MSLLLDALNSRPPSRILVMLREHIGDVVNSTGALLEIRECFPNAHITVEAGERTVGVFESFPAVNEVWSRPTHQGLRGKLAFIRRVRRSRFDLGVILDDSNSYVVLLALARVPLRVGKII